MKKTLIPIFTLMFSFSALAHNVVGGVYAIGNTIEGEAGFSNGSMAPKGTVVEIYNAQGQSLGQAHTDDEGYFQFEATHAIDHHFRVDMGSGHLLEMVLPANELPTALSNKADADQPATNNTVTAAPSNTADRVMPIENDELNQLIESAVARQVLPLRKELAAYKEKVGLQDILGGIGYIVGLCGFGMWFTQRRQTQMVKGRK